ncbi:MAG TPA: hypothetical protein VFS43_43300 [Polyangiaceae bacterium]|nr:hypothetical protein [Polyangiaceae bacterium]
MAQLVNALFLDQTSVRRAVERLLDLGYGSDRISVLPCDPPPSRPEGARAEVSHADKTASGSAIGGLTGALTSGALAAALCSGPECYLGFFAGVGAGGLGGSLLGALVGSILRAPRGPTPDDDPGGTIVAVEVPDERARAVRSLLVASGGKFVQAS